METSWSKLKKWQRIVIVVFFGFTGIQKFLNNKKVLGFAYLLSVGIFCIGWVWDIVCEIFRKDQKGSPAISNDTKNIESIVRQDPIKMTYTFGVRTPERSPISNPKKSNKVNRWVVNYTVVDVETTGFSPINDEIIEIAALKVRKNEVVSEFSQFVHPNKSIPQSVVKLTGITDDMVNNAPSILDVKDEFLSFLEDDIILGHNITFDIKFLQSKFNTEIHNRYVDTLSLSRKLYPNLKHHRLADMVDLLGLTKNTHRSLSDCTATKQLYDRLRERSKQTAATK